LFATAVLATAVSVSAQEQPPGSKAQPASVKPWTPPLTRDGQPDLQGVWLNNAATPLERPKALEGRQFLTDAEVAELKRRAARIFDAASGSSFAAGDNVFLTALADPELYKNPNATGTSLEMIERWFDNRTSLVVDPPDGRIPPMTAEGRDRGARFPPPAGGGQQRPSSAQDLSHALRCLTYGTPRLGLTNTNGPGPLGYYQILQTPGYVVLMLEAIHENRIIPLDGRPHLPDRIRQLSGDSRGRWDGNTLVVETTNFSPASRFFAAAEGLRLVERFTRTAPDTITYEITVSDPTTWTRPWTAVVRLKRSGQKLYEYACHEGNYEVMDAMLSGARAEERAVAGK